WYPAYTIEGLLKLATAVISVVTAIAIWPLIPRALALPSTEMLESRNRDIHELNQKLENRIESLGTLAGGVSHDFNNLLTVIQGNAELLSASIGSEQDRESLTAITEASQRAADLCRQMLAFSGKGHFIFAPVDLNEIVRNLTLAHEPNCTVSWSLSTQDMTIPAAKDQLDQMIHDLALNGLEAINERQVAEGQIVISTWMTDLDQEDFDNAIVDTKTEPGQFAVIEVRDNGIGMHKDLVSRIFDPYYSTKFTGRGLGLSAIQGIVRGHHGCIFVDSEPFKGTAIRVALPVLQPEPSHYKEQPAASDGRLKILVVDDEPQVIELATRFLSKLNADVLTTTD
ncbi:MAG: hypothetical protein HUJ31_00100, partial [Pseudomonadales bacterium]|nr:hypothetical protein [Pseudomonadales bacterium]